MDEQESFRVQIIGQGALWAYNDFTLPDHQSL
jgi:hypothetical protein